ncbi:VOC family protein [Kitasatospora sp. NPDC050543]|uniref:VOC family protein n=1 Tax=Kitasatospora sp. NPDC050543 TaxID=3364054 RepID=UPI003797AB13
MPANATSHVRIARPTRDLAAADRFWTGGLGLDVLYRHEGSGSTGDHSLLMAGWPDAAWHLELVDDPAQAAESRPGVEDLLVIYLGEPVPAELVERLEQHGGVRVPAHNPYWDEFGVTVQDPDGYRLVLSSRGWSNS